MDKNYRFYCHFKSLRNKKKPLCILVKPLLCTTLSHFVLYFKNTQIMFKNVSTADLQQTANNINGTSSFTHLYILMGNRVLLHFPNLFNHFSDNCEILSCSAVPSQNPFFISTTYYNAARKSLMKNENTLP